MGPEELVWELEFAFVTLEKQDLGHWDWKSQTKIRMGLKFGQKVGWKWNLGKI